jgi:hypothetical protein
VCLFLVSLKNKIYKLECLCHPCLNCLQISQVAEDSSSNREWTRDNGWKEGGNSLAQLQVCTSSKKKTKTIISKKYFILFFSIIFLFIHHINCFYESEGFKKYNIIL